MNYDEWCSLSEQEQIQRIVNMDADKKEGIDLIVSACNDIQADDINVVDATPGNFHGGEWVVHAYITSDVNGDYEEKSQIYRFRGFRVYYIPSGARKKG